MNKSMCGVLLASIFGYEAVAEASYKYFNTPLPLYTGRVGYVHYDYFSDEPDNCLGLIIEPWGAGYYRSANNAYGPKSSACAEGSCFPPANQHETLTALLFGASDFTLAQAFANATPASGTNPFVFISTLSPRFAYREAGAFFGIVVAKGFGCDDAWHGGVRLEIPYRDITMDDACSDLVGTATINNVLITSRQESISVGGSTATQNTAWAARLDYLSTLNQIAIQTDGTALPLVIYNNANSNNTMTIGGQSVQVVGPSPTATQPLVSAIESVDGSLPTSVRWANVPTSAGVAIAANGSGLTNLQRGYFQQGAGFYAGPGSLQTNTAQQAQLWIVPNVDGTGSGVEPKILPLTNTMFTAIENASSSGGSAPSSITPFLTTTGIDFCSGRSKGIGDLDAEFFLNRQSECGWIEVQLGFRFPTAKKLHNPLQLARPILGNNGHFEIRPGLVFGCQRFGWVRFMADMTYSVALCANEMIPATFKGATVQNIGPATCASVAWSYFVGTFGLTFMNPCLCDQGVTFAYEPYVKSRSKIRFCQTMARDFSGNLQTLDACAASLNTHRVAHKLRTEIFYNHPCCNLYAGFAQVIAGENISRDTDLYLGALVSF